MGFHGNCARAYNILFDTALSIMIKLKCSYGNIRGTGVFRHADGRLQYVPEGL